MARRGGRIENYYARGLLQIRPTLHLAYRLTYRSVQLLEPTGAAAEGAGLWRFALPAFLVLDVLVWHVLRRSERFGLAWRLPLDALDTAFWTMSPLPASGVADFAILIAVPLAVEAGVRMGALALVVPGAVFVTTTVGAAAVGKPIQFAGVLWVAVGATVGMAFFRYCQHLDQRAQLERERFLAAARRRAYLAGQNSVAMGASSAVDAIEGLVPVLGRPPTGSALWRLADGWKSQLSTSTAQEARYLQVALLEWERLHNAHPDLSGLVRFAIGEGQGTTLLSVAQVRQFGEVLDRLPLRGRVLVALEDLTETHLPGQELRLEVGGHRVVIPADRRAAPAPMDPAAVAYYYVAILVAGWILPPSGRVPPHLIAAGIAICIAAGVLSHRGAVARGKRARLGIIGAAVPISVVLTLLCAHPQFPLRPDGVPVLAHGAAVVLLSFLGGYYWRSLGPWRWLVPAGVTVNVGVALVLYPIPDALEGRIVVAAVVNGLFAFFPCLHLSQTMEAAAAAHAASTEVVDESAERAAFVDGRDSVIGLVRQAQQDAKAQLTAAGSGLDARMAEFAAHRLREVGQRLKAMQT